MMRALRWGVEGGNARHHRIIISDGGKPRRDGGRIAIACWLRLPSDGDKPHRNEDPLRVCLVTTFRSVDRN